MKQGMTELVFILDRSGSMGGLEKDTIGGYNALLKEQQAVDGPCRLTTVLFDNQVQLLHDRIDLRGVQPLTGKDYYVGGSTALNDAVGMTIAKIGHAQKMTAPQHRAKRVLVVIITDGMENASRHVSRQQVKALIERQRERFQWEFLFLGANMDAQEVAEGIGIARDMAAPYMADGLGTTLNFEAISGAAAEYRANACLSGEHMERVRQDYARRGTKQ